MSNLPVRTVHHWTFHGEHTIANPFTDVTVTMTFSSPSGNTATIEAFHDGDDTWRVRFNPGESGRWTWHLTSTPPYAAFDQSGTFEVDAATARGFLQSTPGTAWGFSFENGEPAFIFGDTVYHLFGMAHNGDHGASAVRRFLQRRAEQGFNLLRIRLPVSEFHPTDGYNVWQTRSLWPWRGSPQSPRFDQFNLDYFRTVDWVVAEAESLGLGIEMIIEAWGFEFPFNNRNVFTAAWEDLWFRYLIARYDAFNAVWFWQLQNEYEYYPNGDWNYDRSGVADRWALQMAHRVRELAPHGHPVAIHNGPKLPSFGRRFASDPLAIDTVMFQVWGTTGETDGWLAAGIETQLDESLGDWPGSKVLSEWGYEFNPELPPMMLGHRFCDADHTRRGAWRGVMRGMGIIHGFENSWGPFQELDDDLEGLDHLLHLRRFFHDIVPFQKLQPTDRLVAPADWLPGHSPLALASDDGSTAVVYLPTGGEVMIASEPPFATAAWFHPRTGNLSEDTLVTRAVTFTPPQLPIGDRPDDWVLILRRE